MKKIHLLLLLIALMGLQQAFPQAISYTYDVSGNRINRNVATLKQTTGDTTYPSLPGERELLTETLGELTITVSPNPTRGEVNVAISNLPEGARVESALYNPAGVLLSASPLQVNGSGTINLATQPSGIYYLKLRAGGKQSVWKIIKE
jgi:hypothetical protein